MTSKATSPAPPSEPEETGFSGKLLIIGILTVAFVAAGGSWMFRYSSTHQAAKFWGAETARLIRDAPTVTFATFTEPVSGQAEKSDSAADHNFAAAPQVTRDVTEAHGLVHLRNALLESHSFNWPSQPASPTTHWKHALVFTDSATGHSVCVLFSPESKLVASLETNSTLSFEPISSGVDQMFGEFEALPAVESPAPAR